MVDPLLTALKDRLTAYQPNPVPLNATTLQSAGQSIVDLFTADLGTSALTLAGSASIAFDGDALVVGGPLYGQTVLGLTTPTVTARFTVDDQVLLIDLTIATTTGWTLATSFPHLGKDPKLSGLTLDPAHPPAFVLSSVDGPVDAFGPVVSAGLNLRLPVLADGRGALAGFPPVLTLPAGESLTLTGPASISQDDETFTVRGTCTAAAPKLTIARVPAVTLSKPQAAINAVATSAPGGWITTVGLSVYGVTPTPDGSSAALALDIPLGSGPFALRLASAQPVPFSRLLGFVSGLALLTSIPDAVKSAVTGSLDHWVLGLAGDPGDWRPSSLRLAVSTTDTWTVIPGLVDLRRFQVGLEAAIPASGDPLTTGWVAGDLSLAGGSAELSVTVPLPLDSGDVVVQAMPEYHVAGLGALAALVGGVDLASQLPASVAAIGSFTLTSITVQLNLGTLSVTSIAVSLSADAWTLVPNRLALKQLFIDLAIDTPFSSPALSGVFAGVLLIGTTPVHVLVARGGPGAPWLLEVAVDSVPLPSIGALTELAGVDLSDTLPAPLLNNQLQLTTLGLTADLSAPAIKTFTMVVGTAQPWPVVPPYFSLDQASVGVVLDWTSGALVYSGFLMATLDFGDGDVVLVLRAELRPDKSWLLTGELAQPVALGALVQTALGFTAPDGLANVSVTALSLRYDTGDQSYAFAGSASWVPDLAGVSLEVDASVALSRVPITGQAGKFAYGGRIEAGLQSHFGSDTLALSLAYEFQQPAAPPAKPTQSYVFKLVFNALTLTGSYAKAANGDAVVTVKLGGVTFGDIVAYLVHLVDPSTPATLGSPWDVLYKIHFDDLELVVNLTQRTVGVKDTINLDLGLVNIRTIALTYVTKGGSPTVDIAITGSFLGQDFTDDRPLGWDLLNESPPTTPGAGAALLDLRDLGIGQHLVLAPGATTIPEVLAKLHEVIVSTDGQATPWRVLRFDAEAGWLIGADLTVMGTVSLGLVFNDPVMYGLQVSLAGEKAGPFAGLVFQILYRKVSADVGVYHIALQLPTLMRHLEFGAVSVTLPNVVLDIYTDGGFYIDFGFPYHNDWSVCFGVQVFPFVGAGGFYVGRLTAADGGGALVPQITNGTFGPVVEFGLALALGVGKEISEGPLKAGISVTVQGVLTGVVAWFNPTGSSASSARYYRVDGSLAIVGKLYGSVDFKVISVSVSVVASVTASVVIEAYAPIHLGLSVDVRVQASIKVLFVRIHFSFGMHLDASFTIGSRQATPWTLGPGSGGRAPALRAQRRAEGAHHEFAGVHLYAAITGLEWKPVQVLATKQVVDVILLPIFTVAPDPTSGTPEVTIAFTPSVRTTPPATGGVPTPLDQVTPQPFDWLVTALLRWGQSTLTGQTGGNITAVDLLLVYEDLTAADISQRGFDYTDLAAFLADNVVFTLVAPDPSATQELPGAVLPMLPPLTMTPQGLPPVDFAQAPQVDSAYQRFVQQLLDRLVVNYDYNRSSDPVGGSATTERTLVRDGGEPITEALFADWLLLVARSSVQAAMNELSATRYNAYASTETLIGIARGLAPAVSYTVRTGDTIPSIAQLFGITSTALIAANGSTVHPGQVLTVPAAESLADYVTVPGDTLDSMAAAWQTDAAAITAANPPGTAFDQPGVLVRIPVPAALFDLVTANLGAPLATGTWPISGLRHNVRVGDDLTSVAQQYGSDATTLAAANADQVGVLLANGVAALRLARADGTGAQYTIATGDTLPLIAAYVVVRAAGGTDEPEVAWYTSAISAANGPLGTGPVTVPTVRRTPNGPLQQTGTVTYQPKTGDTVGLIGGYFTLTQLYPEALDDTITQLKQLNPSLDPDHPQPGQVITLPVVAHVIAAGDTLSGVATRFGLQASDLAAQQANATAAILTPNSVLAVPPGTKVPVSGTLQTMASALDLTVAALAGRIGAFTTLFTTGTAVVRPHARQSDVDGLVTRLIGSGQTADVAGMASHFMLHGLRLPMPPDPQTGRISALYRITGQQFAAPAKIDQSYPITFTPDGSPGWVQPIVVHVTKDGETVATIAAQYQGVTPAQVLALNPGIDPDHPPATVRVPQPTVTVTLDQATLTGQSPSTTFDPQVTGGPVREPLFHPAPITHTVGPQVAWTAPTPPDLGGPVGGPAYWALPASLLARLAAGQVSGEYLLGQSPKGGQVPGSPQQVPVWSWATVVPITVRRVTAGAGSMPGTYLVVGADQTDRDVLLSLWTSLEQTGSPVQLFLAYPGASGGLVSDALTDADRLGRVAVLKANLSTITSSGASALLAAGVPPATDAYATLAAPVPFLQLLWEASITGSGGFYLDYSTATQDGLPSSVFSGGADGVVHVVAIVGDPTHPDRALHPYTTGAVVGSPLDPSTVDVFAYAESGDTTVVPTAPPGNIGFGLQRTNPDPGGSPTAETRTQSLFSLLSFGLTGTGFTMPPIALPAGPTVDPADTATWRYDQTVPVAKLVTPVPPDPATGVLPSSADDPYLGVAKQQGGSGGFAGASVVLSFAFTDVFGNELAATPPIADLTAPVAYYDPVLGLSSWPAASGTFAISSAARLVVGVDLGPDKYVPSPANPFAAAVRTAAAHRTIYGQVYYQLLQPDVSCAVTCSLGGELVSGSAAKRPLQGFATAAYLYLGSAQAVQQVWFAVGDDGQTLGGVASAYAVTAGELVAANAAADVTTLTSAQLTIPHDWAVRSTDTLGSISTTTGIPVLTLLTTNQQVPLNTGCVLPTGTITFTTRPGDTFTTVAAVMATTIAALAVANTDSTGILTPGTVTIDGVSVPVTAQDSLGSLVTALHDKGVDTTVAAIATAYANSGLLVSGVPIAVAAVPATPGDTTGVRHHAEAQGESLSHIASSMHGTLSGIALANAQLTGLLRAGVTVEVKGVSAAVGADGSLAGLLAALLEAGGTEVVIGLADIVAALATDETILVEGASVAVVDYVVAKGDTAASVTSSQGFTMAQFARLAAPGPQGVYPTGASLRLSTTAYTALQGDTFEGIAAEFGIGTDELAEANTGLALTVGAQLAAPGAVTLGPVHGAVCVPMTGGVPTLAQLATASGMSLADLGQANATVPDLLAPDVQVTYQGNTTTTTAGSTLASVAAAVHAADAATLVADPEVSALPNLVAPGALVLIGSVAPAGRSLDATASALGVRADDLATANSAVVGLLKSVPITVRGVTVTPQATDTLASVVRRLQRGTAAGAPPITLADLLSAYGGDADLFTADARLLVPPARVEMSADLTTPHVRAPLTPLSAAVTIRRDAALVDPLAAGIGTVVSDTTALSPDFGADGKVDGFAHAFETAYATRRLKLTTGPRTGDGAPPLWVVDFGPNGVSAVQVRPDQPRFFALAPMSRELLGGTVPVGEYDPTTGALDPATPKTFTAVDVDAWMRTALEAVDLFLGPTVAARAWQVQPAGFTTVVEGKQAIADALARRVQPVLGDPVTADALAAARETLRQSMANTLATGYTTDAVVQFPVTVESPFGPVRTTGSSGATLKVLASAYGVSPQHLASAFADVPSVLAVGTTVHAGSTSHQITATDTLATVAAALHLAGVTALPFDQTVFAGNTTPDLAPMTHQVVAGDTFTGLAGYFGTDAGTVGVAAQDVVGLLKPGTVITSGDLSHVVTADDTLGKVAAAVGTTPAVLAARSDLAGDTALLVAGKPMACFSPLNPIPPRLVGRPVATRYAVPAAGDVESLLGLYEVSLAALAGAIGGMAGILTAGVVVGGSYHVVEGDTLTTVARALSPARTVLDLLTGVRDGSVTVTGGTLFRVGAVIALSKLTRRPTDADSFATLADHFGQSPAEVAVANQDVVGALRAGLTFTHLQHSYTTDGSETIALVANRLAYPSAGAFASDPAVVVRTGVFAGDRSLHAVQAVPDFSLSSLKVPLAGGTQYAGFLFSTAADARYRSLFLDVDLVLDEVEFGIRDVVDGYQGSDWLRFPVPLRHSCLGGAVELDADGTDVPIALRSYPQLPLVRALQADPTWGGEGFPVRTIAEGKQWQLTATVEHESSAQDEMRLQVSFGSPADAVYAAAEGDNLLGPLAQFTIAWAGMQHDVAALSALAPGVGDTRLGAMVSTFASLVSNLATALAADTTALMAAPADETYLFSLDTTVDTSDDHLDSVNVTLLDGPTGDVPWPAIAVDVAGKPVPLTAEGVVAGKSQRYAYPANVPAFASLTHHYVFPGTAVPNGVPPMGRDAVRWQHGQCVVSVLRNVPLVAGNPTNPDFVYQTPWIGFANPAVPLLRSAAPIQVGTGPGLADGVRSALTQLLGAAGATTYRFRVLCHYERHLVTSTNGNGTALVSPLPVFYVPLVQAQPSGVDQFAETAGQQAAMWLRTTAITPGVGDAYVLDISVFSNDDTQMTRPLVELTRLTVPLSGGRSAAHLS